MGTPGTYRVDGPLRNPNHQLIGGKHPMIYRVSTIQGVWEMDNESGQLYDLYVFWLMKQ